MRILVYCFFITIIFSFQINSQTTCQLKPNHCGQAMTGWGGQGGEVYSTYVAGANKYKFRAIGTSTDPGYFSERIVNAISSTSAGGWTNIGPFLGMKDTTWYEISVCWSSDGGATWSAFGNSCQIKTCISPTSKLNANYCGIQTTSWNTNIMAIGMPFATQYRFKLKNLPNESFFDQTIIKNVKYFIWSNFQNVPAGKTFECYVQWNNGGDWKPWGQMCYITSPQLTLTPSTMPDRSVFGTAGRYGQYPQQNSISCTVGEPITETFYDGTYIINQGFQQPDANKPVVTTGGTSVSGLAAHITFNAFPNPFIQKITIAAPQEFKARAIIKIVSTTGQLMATYEMNEQFLDMDMSSYAVGKYFVTVYDETGFILDNIQIIKTPNE